MIPASLSKFFAKPSYLSKFMASFFKKMTPADYANIDVGRVVQTPHGYAPFVLAP
jgi:hypothetical protein